MNTWDLFISHASPDKERFVLPLAEVLKNRGVKVWLDKWEISLGESISESISHGLTQSRFGIVVLSEAFFSRAWPKKELAALFASESNGSSRIVPIWYNIEYPEVWQHAPLLADRMAARVDEGIPCIADRVCRLLSHDKKASDSVTAIELRNLTTKLFPNLPADPFWEAQLLADVDISHYKHISDVERAYLRAKPALEAYAREQPSLFRTGTDFLTKALGFVDLCFQSRHNWSPETRTAFRKHADKVQWNISG